MIKKSEYKYILYFLLGVIVSVSLINLVLVTEPIFKVAQDNDWIGFWGSILGSSIGGIITFIVLRITINNENEKREDDRRMDIYPFLDYLIVCDEYIDTNLNTKECKSSICGYHKLCDSSIPLEYKCNVKLKLSIKNIGINKALKIKVINSDKSYKDKKFDNCRCLEVGDNTLINISMILDRRLIKEHTLKLDIFYYNLRMDLYSQSVTIVYYPMPDIKDNDLTIVSHFHPQIVDISPQKIVE